MSVQVGTLIATLRADVAGFVGPLGQAKRAAEDAGKSIQKNLAATTAPMQSIAQHAQQAGANWQALQQVMGGAGRASADLGGKLGVLDRALKAAGREGLQDLAGRGSVASGVLHELVGKVGGLTGAFLGLVGGGVAVITFLKNLQNEANAALTAIVNLSTKIPANFEATRAAIARIDAEMSGDRVAAADATFRQLAALAQQEMNERIRNADAALAAELNSLFVTEASRNRAIGQFRAERANAESEYNNKILLGTKQHQKALHDAEVEGGQERLTAIRENMALWQQALGTGSVSISEFRNQLASLRDQLTELVTPTKEILTLDYELVKAVAAVTDAYNDAARAVAASLDDAIAARKAAEERAAGDINAAEETLFQANIARYKREADEYAIQARRRFGISKETDDLIEAHRRATAEKLRALELTRGGIQSPVSNYVFAPSGGMTPADSAAIAAVQASTAVLNAMIAFEQGRKPQEMVQPVKVVNWPAAGQSPFAFPMGRTEDQPLASMVRQGAPIGLQMPDLATVLYALAHRTAPQFVSPWGPGGQSTQGTGLHQLVGQIKVGEGPFGAIYKDASIALKELTAQFIASARAQQRVQEYTGGLLEERLGVSAVTGPPSGPGGTSVNIAAEQAAWEAARVAAQAARIAALQRELQLLEQQAAAVTARYAKELEAQQKIIEGAQAEIAVAQKRIGQAQKLKAEYDRLTASYQAGLRVWTQLAIAGTDSAQVLGVLAGQMVEAARKTKDVQLAVSFFGAALELAVGQFQKFAEFGGSSLAQIMESFKKIFAALPTMIKKIQDATITSEAKVALLSQLAQDLQAAMQGALAANAAYFQRLREEAEKASADRVAALRKELVAKQTLLTTLEAWQRIAVSIREQLLRLQLGPLGPTNPNVAFGLAQQALAIRMAAFRKAPTAELAADVQAAVQMVLETASQIMARPSPQYQALFASVTAILDELAKTAEGQAATMDDVVAAIEALKKAILAEETELQSVLKKIAQDEKAQRDVIRKAFEAQLLLVQKALAVELAKVGAAQEKARLDLLAVIGVGNTYETFILAQEKIIAAATLKIEAANLAMKILQDAMKVQLDAIKAVSDQIKAQLARTGTETSLIKTAAEQSATAVGAGGVITTGFAATGAIAKGLTTGFTMTEWGGVQRSIIKAMVDQNRFLKVPGYETGVSFVPADQLAFVHRGEAVLTREQNAARMGEGSITLYVTIQEAETPRETVEALERWLRTQRGRRVIQNAAKGAAKG